MRMINCVYPYMSGEGDEVRAVPLVDVGRSASGRRWSCIPKPGGVSKAPGHSTYALLEYRIGSALRIIIVRRRGHFR